MIPIEPREGSSLYYSLLWTTPDASDRFVKRLTMIHELTRTLDDVGDAGVAQRKIHWWHEEIERLIRGEPRHPALQAVSSSLGGRRPALKPLIDILSTAASDRLTPPGTDADVHERLQTSFQARLRLLAHALDGDDTTLGLPSHPLAPLARAAGLREQLVTLPRRLQQGYPVFSEQRYASCGLTPEQLAEGLRGAARHEQAPVLEGATDTNASSHRGAKRQTCLNHAIDEALTAFQTAEDDPACTRFLEEADHEPLTILERLYRAQMALWVRKRPDLLQQRMTLTPVRKWFLAWRTHRARAS